MSTGAEATVVLLGVAILCGGALWLWHRAKNKPGARIMIVALWVVLGAMSMIAGYPFSLIMGAATVMMGLLVWVFSGAVIPRWW